MKRGFFFFGDLLLLIFALDEVKREWMKKEVQIFGAAAIRQVRGMRRGPNLKPFLKSAAENQVNRLEQHRERGDDTASDPRERKLHVVGVAFECQSQDSVAIGQRPGPGHRATIEYKSV